MANIDVPDSVISWLTSGERGISSEKIVTHLYGLPAGREWPSTYPHDPDDLRRCLLLLEASPETAKRFPEMRTASPEWSRLVDHWNELNRLFLEEAGDLYNRRWSAPRTYQAMRSAVNGRGEQS